MLREGLVVAVAVVVLTVVVVVACVVDRPPWFNRGQWPKRRTMWVTKGALLPGEAGVSGTLEVFTSFLTSSGIHVHACIDRLFVLPWIKMYQI